ncbi:MULTISPECIES: winged helix-turn-helix transcriptional regulator [Paraburkholderia]|uniref:winged helix-turn-helix transcriptional regulator n=1 Tax=Paraburkholderia TaxID=1822464 RepID=UPI000B83A483
METDGLVNSVDYKEIPRRVECSLTAFGLTLAGAPAPLCECGSAHAMEVGELIADRKASIR